MTKRAWCDNCGMEVDRAEAQELCPIWDCPISPVVVRDTGDALGRVLAEALAVHGEYAVKK